MSVGDLFGWPTYSLYAHLMAQGGLGTLVPDLIIPRPVQAFSWKLMKTQEKILVTVFLGDGVFGEGGRKHKKRRELGGRKNWGLSGRFGAGVKYELHYV